MQIAVEVDTAGRAVCLTTTKEHAELKRDQIHAYGRDALIGRCQGSMWATIEPETRNRASATEPLLRCPHPGGRRSRPSIARRKSPCPPR